MWKQCQKCFKLKALTDFNRDRSRTDGHQRYCKECNRVYLTRYRARRKRGGAYAERITTKHSDAGSRN